MTSKYTKQELRRDYEEACYDRKNLSIKYGVSAKGKYIQEKINSILKEIRSTQTEFDKDDMRDWFRLDPKVTKLGQYLDGEPIAFVKMLQADYESRAKRGGNSIAGKYARNMYEKITVSNVKNEPKFFEMTITDGEKKLYCRSVLAAQFSEKMIPHFRFIMTERK